MGLGFCSAGGRKRRPMNAMSVAGLSWIRPGGIGHGAASLTRYHPPSVVATLA